MNSGRRISAAILAAALSLGVIGITAGPVSAYRDTTWPTGVSDSSGQSQTLKGSTQRLTDTTWPTG